MNLRHWTLDSLPEGDGLYGLTFDMAGSGVNVLSRETVAELDGLLDELKTSGARGLVIRSAKRSGFLAGADVTEFLRPDGSAIGITEAEALIRAGQAVVDTLERLPMPTLALVHGHCLGGGLELALACTFRVVRADAPDGVETSIGLPEVKLGIHPGFGGVARLVRQIGPLAAMPMMLAGRTVNGRQAARMGLADFAVPDRLMAKAARDVLLGALTPRKTKTFWGALAQAWPKLPPARKIVARTMRARTAERVRPDHYPAPFALIDLWEKRGGGFQALKDGEAGSVAGLLQTPAARNLTRLFLLRTRLKGLARKTEDPVRPVGRVHVVGAGTMGAGIAAWCALSGLRVTLQARRLEQLGEALARARALFAKTYAPLGFAESQRAVLAAMDRLVPVTDPGSGLARADLVIEAVAENPAVKRELYARLEARMRPEAILASNTSSLALDELTIGLTRPERFVGLHFFSPVEKMQLVEVAGLPGTSRETLDRTMGFVAAIGRLPLPTAARPGYLVNRVLMPGLLEAVRMVEEGEPPDRVDAVAREFGMPLGPLEVADEVGLDVCLSVAESFAKHFGTEVPNRLRELVAAGKLGAKSGEGFRRHAAGKRTPPPQAPQSGDGGSLDAETVRDRIVLPMVNAAVACLGEGVVAAGQANDLAALADLADAGLVFGAGFAPFRGGPVQYLRDRGPGEVRSRLDELGQRFGQRFATYPDDAVWSAVAPCPSGGGR